MSSTANREDRESGLDVGLLLTTLIAFRRGDFSTRMPNDWTGVNGKIADTLNDIIDMAKLTTDEYARVSQVVGKAGKMEARLLVTDLHGSWAQLVESSNSLIEDLVRPSNEIVRVIKAVSNGDLSQKVATEIDGIKFEGQFFKTAVIINAMVDRLSTFSTEVIRVAREVGMEGKLGGQANVPGVSGTWKDLTDNVNSMATNLTVQVRGIAKVVTAVANGDLSKKVTVDVKGEIADLAGTINSMTETLALFADQVTQVAREVGMEGKLGGQANVPGVSGTWKDLTDNVNSMATNLTDQVRAIAGVATAVTKGDLTRSVTVEAKGEMAELKDNVNEMIRNLLETTNQNSEQDWLKTNLAKFTSVLQGQRDTTAFSETLLSQLAQLVSALHGVFYLMEESSNGEARLTMLSSYAYKKQKNIATEWKMGEGLVGQCAIEKKRILLTNVPDDYIQITSGLGEAKPLNILVLPMIFEGEVKAVIELASFVQFSSTQLAFLDQLADSIGTVINTIEINMRTEELLRVSQALTEELQSQQEELRETNDELGGQAQLLEEQKIEVETKNLEIEQAKAAIEEKASQLELTSRYKSEFLANMSHELRTPLNNLLILSGLLEENKSSHLDVKEVEFAKLIHASGKDLLSLINEILDLSKIESGTVSLNLSAVPFAVVHDQIEGVFRHVAESRKLDFEVSFASDLPSTIVTDEMRLLQVIKNLLSNALKFTEKGQVSLRVNRATSGWSTENKNLNKADEVFAFTVEDTGLGISADKQFIIFEAFQQGGGGTARKYGGTGLGLSISRGIAQLLGGELKLEGSTPQQGSTFVLYVPQNSMKNDSPEPIPESWQSLPSEEQSKPVSADSAVNLDASGRALRALHESDAADDRATIKGGDRVLLIIEDDPIFAKIILDLAREKGFKGIVAMRGVEALELVRSHKPDAITLDIHLPDLDGWTILEILKLDHDLRHIPVNIISMENDPLPGLSHGALQHLIKPVSRDQLAEAMDAIHAFLDRPIKNLLLVAANKDEDDQITELLGDGDITIHHADGGKSGLVAMSKKSFDCVVVGTKLSDMSGTDFIVELRQDKLLRGIPVIVFIGAQITDSERATLGKLADSSVIKNVESLEHLLDQTTLFLHRVVSRMPEDKRKLLQQFQEATNNLAGKKVLIVDDDARNIFALTAALQHRGVVVLSAENGAAAIDLLKRAPDMDLVLMDIMMPGMDGYETMREIRKLGNFKKLPIIALTANAMVGDREKCLEAGASDYLSKPINIWQLTSLMQVWLSR